MGCTILICVCIYCCVRLYCNLVFKKEKSTMTGLEVTDISKHYKTNTALQPFSLAVQEGQCVSLCGGNGAGKSTILNILASISSPSAGTVLLDGVNMSAQNKEYVSLIGYMPDEFYAQGDMNVGEFMSF